MSLKVLLESHLLGQVGVVAFFAAVWFVTWYFYHKHRPEIVHAVEDGRASERQVVEESTWFHKATLALGILALIGIHIPQDWWLASYLIATTVFYFGIASFNESMLRSEVRKSEYEPEDQSELA